MIAALPRLVLALFAVINIGRGAIHTFAPDGGARSIAGIDMAGAPQTILALFATIGIMQLCLGAFELFAVARRPELVAPVLVLQTANTAFGVLHLYLYRPLPVVVPGAAFNLALLALLASVWAIMLTRRSAMGSRQ